MEGSYRQKLGKTKTLLAKGEKKDCFRQRLPFEEGEVRASYQAFCLSFFWGGGVRGGMEKVT